MEVLKIENIVLNLPKEDSKSVIDRVGKMLVDSGYVNSRYIEGMHKRDAQLSLAIGNFIAIPHGEVDYKKDIKETGIVILTYPEAVDWNGQDVHIVVGIAAKGEEHNDILGNIVDIFEDEEDVKNFLKITDKTEIHKMLTGGAS